MIKGLLSFFYAGGNSCLYFILKMRVLFLETEIFEGFLINQKNKFRNKSDYKRFMHRFHTDVSLPYRNSNYVFVVRKLSKEVKHLLVICDRKLIDVNSSKRMIYALCYENYL